MTVKNFFGLVLLLLIAIVSTPAVRTQTTDEPKNQDKSVAAKRQESEEPPRDGQEWFERAYRMHGSDRYAEAIESFKRAVELDYRKATAMYNIACGYAMLNDKENAFLWLQRALDNGFDQTELLANDSDLDPLRTDARFKKIIANLPVEHSRVSWKDTGKRDRLEQANFDYARLESERSTEGEEWAKVGARMLMLRELDRSVIALKKGIDQLNDDSSSAMYNLACAYSLKGDREAGIQWLEKSVNAGFDSPQKLRYDPDINYLRSDARFARIEKLSNTLSLSQFQNHEINYNHDEDSNYSKERWAPAINLYESFVKTEPNNGRAWFNLGYAFHFSREHAKAITAFERALALGYHKPTTTYNIACCYAMLDQRDAAFEWLDRAVKAGFKSHGHMSSDRDLESLRSDPRFKQFLQSVKTKNKMRKMKSE